MIFGHFFMGRQMELNIDIFQRKSPIFSIYMYLLLKEKSDGRMVVKAVCNVTLFMVEKNICLQQELNLDP